jgi:hypothetical protein
VFTTAFTKVWHLTLCSTSWKQLTLPQIISLTQILILSCPVCLCLPRLIVPLLFLDEHFVSVSHFPTRATCLYWLNNSNYIRHGLQVHNCPRHLDLKLPQRWVLKPRYATKLRRVVWAISIDVSEESACLLPWSTSIFFTKQVKKALLSNKFYKRVKTNHANPRLCCKKNWIPLLFHCVPVFNVLGLNLFQYYYK